jgi:4-amino-4-deoxy-L-arabinose transferase-like glycosyltransferase
MRPKGSSSRHASPRTTALPPPRAASLTRLVEHPGGSLALLGVLLAIAASLRLWGLAYRDLWFDELGAIAMAASGDWWVSEGGNPPLFVALLGVWTRIFGTDISTVRLLSALAGIGAVVALNWVAIELRLPAPVRLWGVALFAVSPLQVYYSQEARAYALLVLLLLLALGSFLRAIATGSRRWWCLHGACLLAGLYTHNMMIPMVGAFWVSALLLSPPRQRWVELAVVHATAALAYAPWIPQLVDQAAGDAHLWIAHMVRGVSPFALVIGSMEGFNLGGRWPDHLNFPNNPQTAPWSALFFLAAACMAVVAARPASGNPPLPPFRRSLALLLVFAAWPIAFLVLYS